MTRHPYQQKRERETGTNKQKMAQLEEVQFLQNVRHVLLNLLRRLLQDVSDDVADYAYYKM